MAYGTAYGMAYRGAGYGLRYGLQGGQLQRVNQLTIYQTQIQKPMEAIKTDKQIRHESILQWTDLFEAYQGYDQRPSLQQTTVRGNQLTSLRPTDINPAVIVFTDVLNLPAGSFSGGTPVPVDLYKLMQAYLTDESKRKAINQIID